MQAKPNVSWHFIGNVSPPGCAASRLRPATPISSVDKTKNWLPRLRPLRDQKTNFRFIIYMYTATVLPILTRSSAIADGPRDASCQLKSCQLPRNSAKTTCTTSPEQIEVMKLEGYSGPMCNKHVHSTVTRSSRFHCPIGVINKPTTVELCVSPVYRRLAVAKFSKSIM